MSSGTAGRLAAGLLAAATLGGTPAARPFLSDPAPRSPAEGTETLSGRVPVTASPRVPSRPVASTRGSSWTGSEPGSSSAFAGSAPLRSAPQDLPFHPYDGSWTFVRIRTAGRGSLGGWGFRRWGGGGWAHDYPDAERNFTRIVDELTLVPTTVVPSGGNVLTFDDARLFRFPLAYVSEPDEWRATPEEAAALREYLLKGGFVIFDDFFEWEMENLVVQMKRVFPELDFLPLDGPEEIWESFFSIQPDSIYLEGPRKEGTPRFWGLYEGNDKRGRMLAVAGAGADIGDLWEWSDRGFFPIDPTNEAYRIGINYLIYAFTH